MFDRIVRGYNRTIQAGGLVFRPFNPALMDGVARSNVSSASSRPLFRFSAKLREKDRLCDGDCGSWRSKISLQLVIKKIRSIFQPRSSCCVYTRISRAALMRQTWRRLQRKSANVDLARACGARRGPLRASGGREACISPPSPSPHLFYYTYIYAGSL